MHESSPANGQAPGRIADSHWDVVIGPRAGWFELNLAELWRYRELIGLFVRRDFVSQFKQTLLGPLWFILQPLLTTLILTLVFSHVAGLSTDQLPRILFYLSGCILWQYFASCLTQTSTTFSANAQLFGKVYFPRLAVPVSVTISQLVKMALQLICFAALALFFVIRGAELRLTWAAGLLPLLMVIMAGLSLGLGVLISALTRKYRDLAFLLQFCMPLAMYTTTVAYPLSALPAGPFRTLVVANPMTPVIETFRFAVLGTGSYSGWHLAYATLAAAVALLTGALIFSRVERTFMDTV